MSVIKNIWIYFAKMTELWQKKLLKYFKMILLNYFTKNIVSQLLNNENNQIQTF